MLNASMKLTMNSLKIVYPVNLYQDETRPLSVQPVVTEKSLSNCLPPKNDMKCKFVNGLRSKDVSKWTIILVIVSNVRKDSSGMVLTAEVVELADARSVTCHQWLPNMNHTRLASFVKKVMDVLHITWTKTLPNLNTSAIS